MESFINALKSFGLSISSKQLDMFETYYRLITEKNKVMNLTAITERDEVYLKHFTDSLAMAMLPEALPVLTSIEGSLLDIGTGAGLPGIPLKIMFPSLNVTLVDSLGKRIRFLEDVIEELGLENISAVHSRAEDIEKTVPGSRSSFDIVTSRAVTNLPVLSEYSLPFVKTGGYFIPYKSMSVSDELNSSSNALKILHGEMVRVHEFTLPGSDIGRSLIIIGKNSPSPKKYPRKPGDIKKSPL